MIENLTYHDTNFAITFDKTSENYYCGIMKHGSPNHGLIFDKDKNYYNYSTLQSYKGQSFSAETGIGYIGDLKAGKPHGLGMLMSEVGVRYMGNFSKGLAKGKGMIFKESSEIKADQENLRKKKRITSQQEYSSTNQNLEFNSNQGFITENLVKTSGVEKHSEISPLNIKFIGIMHNGEAVSGIFDLNNRIFSGFLVDAIYKNKKNKKMRAGTNLFPLNKRVQMMIRNNSKKRFSGKIVGGTGIIQPGYIKSNF